MSDKGSSFTVGHRERLKAKFLNDKLADYELLELLLTYAIPRRDVKPLAHKLIRHFGGVYFVFTAPIEKLMECDGVGRTTAILIKLVQNLMLINHRYDAQTKKIYHNPEAFIEYIRLKLTVLDHEELHVYYLGADFTLVHEELHTRGSVDESPIYQVQILKQALNLSAKSIVLAHNHPTTSNSFSTPDIEMTHNLEIYLNMSGISLYDHFVVSGGIVHSMRELGVLNKSSSDK
ncbi:MAG: RadC family protein [Alphaproteobacteria bacterium]|nr:RadC family protein [Alphaproteobacteria bacterium]